MVKSNNIMEFESKQIEAAGTRFTASDNGTEVARVYLYLLRNDLHQQPFGFIEDIFVNKSYRNRGIGLELAKRVIAEARQKGCYKLICTSRYEKPEVHDSCRKLGFKEHGKEFRIDF